MAAQLTTQIVGKSSGAEVEVELNTLARRFVARPQDFKSLGAYHAGNTYTCVNALTSAVLPALAGYFVTMQPPSSPGVIVLIHKIYISLLLNQLAGGTGANVAYTVGLNRIQNYFTGFGVAQDGALFGTGYTRLSPSGGCKLNYDFPDSTMIIQMPPDATAGHATMMMQPNAITASAIIPPLLGGGTHPISNLTGMGANATNMVVIPYSPLFIHRTGEYPFVLEPLSGAAIGWISTPPTFAVAAATMVFNVSIQWEELLHKDYDR